MKVGISCQKADTYTALLFRIEKFSDVLYIYKSGAFQLGFCTTELVTWL